MARAHRHYVAGEMWHLTHRCHEREFLLQFRRDREAWIGWLDEAQERFGLCVLDYMVTSNHVHLMVEDREGGERISDSMQLVAGRVGQEYNRRRGRHGAFWEDRYHATAIESGEHFRRCLAYIDLNMVRAGVVRHPVEWTESGYAEIQHPRSRYRIIDEERLMELMGVRSREQLQRACREQVEEAVARNPLDRQRQWTESVAVGSEAFVQAVKRKLGWRGRGREALEAEDGYQLREEEAAYKAISGVKKGRLSLKKKPFGDLSSFRRTT